MIKIFRQIRQTLVISGNSVKYLKYAIGEIILVVIGILIALQINTWNENRKDRISEAIYYCKFLEDVDQDQAILLTQIQKAKTRLHHANKLLHNLQNSDTQMNELIFDMTGSVSSIDSKMQVTTTAFEDLKSSGSLVIIKDPKIKKKLTDYYSTAQGILTVVNDNNTAIGNRFKNNDDRINAGWVYLIEKQNGFDTTLININDLKSKVFMNESLKTKLMNDALSYLGTSSRNIEHFENLQKEIEIIKATLEKKCQRK
ncbi:MAG: DUF6090 family protein [Saprospiraceae bacterium]